MKIKLQAFDESIQIEWNNKDNMAFFSYDEEKMGEKIVNTASFFYSCPDSDIYECNENFTRINISLDNLLNIISKLS
jgi:hypothetical protein